MSCAAWQPEYLREGPRPQDGPGWYGTRTQGTGEPGTGLLCSFTSRFETEDECRAWCREANGGIDAPPRETMEEYGRRLALEREQRILDALLNAE